MFDSGVISKTLSLMSVATQGGFSQKSESLNQIKFKVSIKTKNLFIFNSREIINCPQEIMFLPKGKDCFAKLNSVVLLAAKSV